jgi:hypothetical protein
MSLTKETKIDEITIDENFTVLVREITRIKEDGKEISKSFHRYMLTPRDDISAQPDIIINICQVVWTEENLKLRT